MMSSALKPVLPPTGAQTTTPNTAPPKPLPPQGMSHNVPTSYNQPMSHVPQNLGLPHSTNMTANILPNVAPQNPAPHTGIINTPPINIPTSHVTSPNKSAGLPISRPNMIPYHPNSNTLPREEEGTTLPPSQNAAQLMAVHRAQEQVTYSKPQSNGTAPAQPSLEACNKSPTVPAPVEVKPEPPVAPVQNHVPETAKQPIETPPQVQEKPPVVNIVPPTPPQPVLPVPAIPIPIPIPISTPTPPVSTPAPVVPAPVPAVEPTPKVIPTPPVVVPEPAAEAPHTATTPTKAIVPKEIPPTKPPTTLKLATTSPRAANRKREVKPVTKPSPSSSSSSSSSSDRQSESPKTPVSNKSSVHVHNKTPGPAKVKGGRGSEDERQKTKRTRTRTQPYQSPLPELALITKLSSTPTPKALDEKLIVFYKNEFLAVRNAEGGFYVCQAVQNVYKSSPRIRIRWLSQDKNDKTYIPDFYDFTDFDCILTNINMERIEKGKYNLPKEEEERTENILKRALAVENGDAAPSLTEEHPDGLDLSLFRDESQLKKKRKGTKRKSTDPLSGGESSGGESPRNKKSPDKAKIRKTSKTTRSSKTNTSLNYSAADSSKKKKAKTSGRAERAKRRGEVSPVSSTKSSPVVDQKKAKVLAKVALKTALAAHQAAASKNQKKSTTRTTPTTKVTSTPVTASSSRAGKSTRSQAAVPTVSNSITSRRAKKTNRK